MPYNFEIKLSFTACLILIGLIELEKDIAENPLKPGGMDHANRLAEFTPHSNQFIRQARTLGKLGLINPEPGKWDVTEKGKMIAKVIEMDIAEFSDQIPNLMNVIGGRNKLSEKIRTLQKL